MRAATLGVLLSWIALGGGLYAVEWFIVEPSIEIPTDIEKRIEKDRDETETGDKGRWA